MDPKKKGQQNQKKSSSTTDTSSKNFWGWFENFWGWFETENNLIAPTLIVLSAFATLSVAFNKWYDNTFYSMIFNPIYWIIVAGLITASLKKIYKKEANIDIAETFALIAVALGLALILIQAASPSFCLVNVLQEDEPEIASSVTKKHSGKILTISLKPQQVYEIDEVKEKQSWKYLSFNGAFSHRIDKGDDQACWKLVQNNLPWHADYAGKLQVKAGNTPVYLTIEII